MILSQKAGREERATQRLVVRNVHRKVSTLIAMSARVLISVPLTETQASTTFKLDGWLIGVKWLCICCLVAGLSRREAVELALRLLETLENKGHEECSAAIRQAVALRRNGDLAPAPEVIEQVGRRPGGRRGAGHFAPLRAGGG